MKKLFTFIAIAVLAVACCNQQPATPGVEKFFENAATLVDQETTVTGTVLAIVCPETKNFIIGTESQQLMIVPPAEKPICKGCVGKAVDVKGIVKQFAVNEEFIASFEETANAYECPEMKEACLQKLAEFKAEFEAKGEYVIYYIEASEITCKESCHKEGKEGCCKDGEKKEGCCKDGEKHEGCGEKKEGCCKDGEKHEECKEKKAE